MPSFLKTLHPDGFLYTYSILPRQERIDTGTKIGKRQFSTGRIAVVEFHILYCTYPTFFVTSICLYFLLLQIHGPEINSDPLVLFYYCLLLPKLPRMRTGRGVSHPSWPLCSYVMMFLVFVNKKRTNKLVSDSTDTRWQYTCSHFFFCSVLPSSFVLPAVVVLAPRSEVSRIGVWKWIVSEIMVTKLMSRRRKEEQ